MEKLLHALRWSALGLILIPAQGCQPSNPNAQVEAPIVTDDAPRTSEEAAAQAEPPAKGK